MGGNVLVLATGDTSVRCWSLIFSNAVIRLSDWMLVIFPSACCSRKRLPTGESPATYREWRRGLRASEAGHTWLPFPTTLGRTQPVADGGHRSRCDRAAGPTGQARGVRRSIYSSGQSMYGVSATDAELDEERSEKRP